MRVNEIASAEEQLALWKLISDNTWRAIAQQTSEHRKQQAAKAQQRKLKTKRGGRKSFAPPLPIKTPPPKIKAHTPTTNSQKNSWGVAPQAVGTVNPLARNLPHTTGFNTAHKATVTTASVA